jgi:hypothetical protein
VQDPRTAAVQVVRVLHTQVRDLQLLRIVDRQDLQVLHIQQLQVLHILQQLQLLVQLRLVAVRFQCGATEYTILKELVYVIMAKLMLLFKVILLDLLGHHAQQVVCGEHANVALQPKKQLQQHPLMLRPLPRLQLQPQQRLQLMHLPLLLAHQLQVEQADHLVAQFLCGQEMESLIMLDNVCVTMEKHTKPCAVIPLKQDGLQTWRLISGTNATVAVPLPLVIIKPLQLQPLHMLLLQLLQPHQLMLLLLLLLQPHRLMLLLLLLL